MNYKSPIETFYSDVQLKFEDGVYKAVQAVDIHVDRDELIKALQYDRQQYEKGWHDALLKEQEAVKPCVAVDTWICPKCGHALESQYLIDDKENPQVLVHEQYNFCPNCGKAVKWND